MARLGARAALAMQFANTLHVLNGLLELGRAEEARDYLSGEIERYRQLRHADELRRPAAPPPLS